MSAQNSSAGNSLLARVCRRRQPEQRLLGALAVALRHRDRTLLERTLSEALAWPEDDALERTRKAQLIFALTALLAQSGQRKLALKLAPRIPHAPGMAQVLVFSTEHPPQTFCWRVTPAYALVRGRRPTLFPIDPLIRPYQRGLVTIDSEYVQRVLLVRRYHPPILLLPHPRGLVRLERTPYVILDGNHRVVCAWEQRQPAIAGFVLDEHEAAAVLMSHSQWPPYNEPDCAPTNAPRGFGA